MSGLFTTVMVLLLNPVTLIAVFAWAVWRLRSTASAPEPLSEGQRRGRMLALAALVLLVGGFGLCGGAGTVAGVMGLSAGGEGAGYAMLFLLPGLAGLAVALLCVAMLRRYRRRAETAKAAP
jgi:heme/copper-type cytochrome/quinol oxidase subunit 2